MGSADAPMNNNTNMETPITLLNHLPPAHELRNKPIAGAWFRQMGWGGGDITIPREQRGPDWQKWGWGPWQQVGPQWRAAKATFNQLGGPWINNAAEWTFDDPR